MRICMPWKDKSKYKSEAYREYMRNYQKSWHQKHKAQRLAHALERKEYMRAFYNQLKENLECSLCGENHPATLHFHDLDPENKDFNLSAAVRNGYGVERIKREVAKCTVLCANCHAKLHYEWARTHNRPVQEGLSRSISGSRARAFCEPGRGVCARRSKSICTYRSR
jgi:hypothetical protein